MQVAHTELPPHNHDIDGKAKVKAENDHKHNLHHPDTDHKKELLEKMREVKPKE